MITKYILLMLLIFSQTSFANELYSKCYNDNDVQFVFINGVGYSLSGVNSNVKSLNNFLTKHGYGSNEVAVTFAPSYQDEPLISYITDVINVLRQKKIEWDPSSGPDRDWRTDILRILEDADYEVLSEVLPEGNRELILDVRREIVRVSFQDESRVEQKTVALQAAYLTERARVARRVVVVAHSQGTIYSNLAYSLVPEELQRKFDFIYVGGAAGYLPEYRAEYVLSKSDPVINALRSQYSVLQGNVGEYSLEHTLHGFSDYLKKYDAEISKIVRDLDPIYEPDQLFFIETTSYNIIGDGWNRDPSESTHVIDFRDESPGRSSYVDTGYLTYAKFGGKSCEGSSSIECLPVQDNVIVVSGDISVQFNTSGFKDDGNDYYDTEVIQIDVDSFRQATVEDPNRVFSFTASPGTATTFEDLDFAFRTGYCRW